MIVRQIDISNAGFAVVKNFFRRVLTKPGAVTDYDLQRLLLNGACGPWPIVLPIGVEARSLRLGEAL